MATRGAGRSANADDGTPNEAASSAMFVAGDDPTAVPVQNGFWFDDQKRIASPGPIRR
jgi:hypothetical protein